MILNHDQTLRWISEHRAWRVAKKTKPIWARPIEPDEIGKDFQTADNAVERAAEGYWLCVGIAGEPWFQQPDKIEAKYDRARDEGKQFAFDERPHVYFLYHPKSDARIWAAQVTGPDITAFSIRPGYDMDHPLSSPAGGYAARDFVSDPYAAPGDVWLVQKELFESTYEFQPG